MGLTMALHGATLELGPEEPLPAHINAFNINLLMETAFQGISYSSPQVVDVIKELSPQGLRFPGGTLANNYLWREDSFSEPDNDLTVWAGEHIRLIRKLRKKYDLPGFIRLCEKTEQSPIWVLNVYEESPENTLALVDHLAAQGIKLEAIELANEPYWDKRSHNDVQAYMEFCKPLAEALKKHHPEIQIGACFAPIDNPADYRKNWNAVLARETWFDAIIYHEYYGGQGFALEAGKPLPVETLLKPEAMLEAPLAEFSKQMPGKPVWFTEWNIGGEGLKEWKNSGAELLFLGAMWNCLIDHRDTVKWGGFHTSIDGTFGTAFIDSKGGMVVRQASWEFFRLLKTTLEGGEIMRSVTIAGLQGFAVTGAKGTRIWLLNRSADDVDVTLPANLTKLTELHSILAPPEQRFDPSQPLITRHEIVGGKFIIPGHSINLVGSEINLQTQPQPTANLFPPRPLLTLWYPPYAATQPAFDPDGIYTVETTALKDKELAVVKVNLAQLGLEAGGNYEIALEISGEAGGVVVKLPDKKATRDDWQPLDPTFRLLRLSFTYDPAVNEGGISIVIPHESLATAVAVKLKDFRVSRAD